MASVPAAAVFSLPLAPWQQPASVRVAQYEPRKRKKDFSDWGDDDDDVDGDTTDAASEAAPGPSLTLSPDEAHQYRIAGLAFDQELPGGNFPHAPTRNQVLKELTSLPSPIYPPQSAAHQGNLRLQHLAVLSSILHRCLLQKDFVRAGRAWGLILREEIGGIPIDVRTEGRWGIGAEILLRRDCQVSGTSPDNAQERDAEPSEAPPSKLLFTRQGFEKAKQYYETLIIQHPYRKAAPDAISSLHFYPAMFGLWVYVTQEESNVSRQKIWDAHGASPDDSEEEDSTLDMQHHDDTRQKTHALVASVRKSELEQAQKIAARMDEILGSPPYSDSPELLELRGMISLWIADLFVSSLPYGRADGDMDDYDSDETGSSSAEDLQDSLQERRERRLAVERKEYEVQKSQDYFAKAKQRGKGVTSTFGDLHIDDDDASFGYTRVTMGVGDYVHSKEAGQPRPRTTEASKQSRQALAAQARVDVPPTNLVAPVPLPINKSIPLEHYSTPAFSEQMPQAPAENGVHRDMFDTDVEGIDDSTIAATSVMGAEDAPLQFQLRPATVPQYQEAAPVADERPLHPSRLPRRAYDGKWYENLGDNAMKSAGFDSEDADDASQLTSMAGDDERSDTTEDGNYARRYRSSTEEPLSKRLQSFWTASRRSYQNPEPQAYPEPSKTAAPPPPPLRQSTSDARLSKQALPNRKVTLPRSMTATPRTRFSPPKPSLLEQLDITPTRRTSGPRPQPGKEPGFASTTNHHQRHNSDDNHLFNTSRDSLPPLTAFDMTNIDDLDVEDDDHDPINDPFARRNSVQRIVSDDPDFQPTKSTITIGTSTKNKRRNLESDYPPEILRQKSFKDLQSEPFDHTPTAPAKSTPTTTPAPNPGPNATSDEKIDFLLNSEDKDRRDFFSTLTMNEWEDYGDLLIDQFSDALSKMKDLRHARRKTAALFEAEIARRNEVVEEQSADLTRKLEEMRSGGAEVLRGRTP
ncbi:hypothetical protein BO83DRAFT_408729 [Aspergillus eucalypticola CBS 122712]|uniref:Extracellular mutant protein 11 C-terminal domain-containing protein n=1 Tax=Aspergillus eucalypticola (strain CBS 122712 / IBT 29274) TaxID=1448314 RepID=A0A317VFZ5_ASPEC|nr:uncharacterized protein BO83DRAFT_408729 [Aspergillus eucalypticola CBS 122712]PWY72037.1 hypothetical protein BO83DRAFT_408729 [Aspergillus eucalypticola CBS 122712]